MSNGLRWTDEEYARWAKGRDPEVTRSFHAVAPEIVRDPFLVLLVSRGIPLPVPEFQPIPDRKFALDYAWPHYLIGIEQQGYKDHSSRKGLQRDYEKSNLCQLAGWLYLQFTPKQLHDGSALPILRAALAVRAKGRDA